MGDILHWRGVPVPYITAWGHEVEGMPAVDVRLVVAGTSGVARVSYADETPYDRDAHGALWQRYRIARGKGEARFSSVHPGRQRRAMTRRLCQVCGDPADQNEQGWLWLVSAEDSTRITHTGQDIVRTAHPPVCEPCSRIARQYCPHLVKGNALVRAGTVSDWGVYGIEVTAQGQHPGTQRAYSDPASMQILAGQMIVILRNLTVIEWSDRP